MGEALRATAAGAKGVGAKPEAAGWRLAVVGVRPALLGKEVARPAERGVGRLPCGSSPPNGDTRMARRCRGHCSGAVTAARRRPWAKAMAGPAAATASWT